jgi:hypothetical protein
MLDPGRHPYSALGWHHESSLAGSHGNHAPAGVNQLCTAMTVKRQDLAIFQFGTIGNDRLRQGFEFSIGELSMLLARYHYKLAISSNYAKA